MITVKKLVKRFGLKTVLRGVDFEVQPGEFVALLGPNGAGKTTFLRILASLSRPSLGEVRVAGYRLPNEAAAVRARLGVVSHLPLLYGDLSAEENLRFYGRMYGIENLEARITEVLEMVGLDTRRRGGRGRGHAAGPPSSNLLRRRIRTPRPSSADRQSRGVGATRRGLRRWW